MAELKNGCRLGERVWWMTNDGYVRYGTATEVCGKMVNIRKVGSFVTSIHIDDCYPTEEACRKADEEQKRREIDTYKASMQTVGDLVRFLYGQLRETYQYDEEAVKAVEERAPELGILLRGDRN